MKESIPSMVQPPHAAQKLRPWFPVSRGVVLEDDSGMRFTTTPFLDRLSIFNIQRRLRTGCVPIEGLIYAGLCAACTAYFQRTNSCPLLTRLVSLVYRWRRAAPELSAV